EVVLHPRRPRLRGAQGGGALRLPRRLLPVEAGVAAGEAGVVLRQRGPGLPGRAPGAAAGQAYRAGAAGGQAYCAGATGGQAHRAGDCARRGPRPAPRDLEGRRRRRRRRVRLLRGVRGEAAMAGGQKEVVLQERGAGLFQGVAGVSGVGPRPRRSGTALGRWRRVAHSRVEGGEDELFASCVSPRRARRLLVWVAYCPTGLCVHLLVF
ncbi:unnamed protein product, partial [Prorocentrum cordatum]